MPTYRKTRLCGCGECRFKPMSAGPCPLEKSKNAIWLWASDYKKDVSEEQEEEQVPENIVLDTSAVEEVTEEELV